MRLPAKGAVLCVDRFKNGNKLQSYHRSSNFCIFGKAHLTFQLSTLLFGSSLSSRACYPLSMRFPFETCVCRELPVFGLTYISHMIPPGSI
jgi:hypothetical protein